MKSILALFLLFAVASSARIPRDVQENAEPSTIENMMNTAKTGVQSLSEEIQKIIAKTTDEMKDKNPEVEKFLESVKNNFVKTADDFNANFPNAKEQFAVFQDKIKEAFNVVSEESAKINTKLKEAIAAPKTK